MSSADVVVIGGGIIGCACALHLARALPDARIVVVDRGAIAGATSGSCMGHLMVTPADDEHYRLTSASVRMWRELHDEYRDLGSFDYNPTGALYLADGDEDLPLLGELQRQFAARGDEASVLDPRQLRALEPGLADDLPGALFYPGDGVVLPMTACTAMLRLAMRANPRVEVRPGQAVTAVERAGDRVVAVGTAAGRIATAHAVLACGVWTPAVAALAGLPVLPIVPRAGNLAITAHHASPIRTQLLEVAYLRVAHGASQADPHRTDVDTGAHAVNMQPQSHGGCLIGSTRQFRGMDRTLNRELLHRSLSRAARYAPQLRDLPIVRTWVGLRPYPIDGTPWIGPWPELQGLWLATGHEGLGISLSMITGHLIARQLAGGDCEVDPAPYLPRPARCA
ncbi:MAG: NAD(P)/FAD-dependent oxidoreductase [Planctomycetota bacterium]